MSDQETKEQQKNVIDQYPELRVATLDDFAHLDEPTNGLHYWFNHPDKPELQHFQVGLRLKENPEQKRNVTHWVQEGRMFVLAQPVMIHQDILPLK